MLGTVTATTGAPPHPLAAWIARTLTPRMVRAHAAWLVSFALVVYLGLSDGGYDLLVWGEVGVVAWLLVGLGALVGLLPVKSLYKSGWLATAALIGLTAWTALGISWAESSERAVTELARTSTYLGVFLL